MPTRRARAPLATCPIVQALKALLGQLLGDAVGVELSPTTSTSPSPMLKTRRHFIGVDVAEFRQPGKHGERANCAAR